MVDATPEPAGPTVAALHQALVDQLVQASRISSAAVEAAFRAVPRHLFLPGFPLDEVYRDDVVRTKSLDGEVVSSSSQPGMMAIMLEQLGLEPGQRVLEIGAATGYNAALVAHLVGPTGSVVTLDIDEDLAAHAYRNLTAAGVANVTVACRDGWYGYGEAAPFDRIILTVAADDLAPAWAAQLAPDGRLLLPLVLRAGLQACVAFERQGDTWASVSVRVCGFMPLRGEHAVTSLLPRAHDADLGLTLHSHAVLTVEQVAAWLEGPQTNVPTDVRVSRGEPWRSLVLWLALYVGEPCVVVATGEALRQSLVPGMWVADDAPTVRVAYGSANAAGMSLIYGQRRVSETTTDDERTVELVVRSYGGDASLAEQVRRVIMGWDAAGRPTTNDLRVRATSAASRSKPRATEVVLDRPSSQLVLDVHVPAAADPPSAGL